MGERIVILDFGAQYTQLIARSIREAGVFAEIHPWTEQVSPLQLPPAMGVVLSGGPYSIYDKDAPQLDPAVLDQVRQDGSPLPVLGICYGLQAMAHLEGGTVAPADHREFGRAVLQVTGTGELLDGVPSGSHVWMSHGDALVEVPPGYEVLAHTKNAPVAAVRHTQRPHYGVQFHPEVVHTEHGRRILRNFVLRICSCSGSWSPASFLHDKVREVRHVVGEEHVILGLSGGVDSSVAACLLHQAIGDQLTCVFVNNGLLRSGEYESVQATFRDEFNVRLRVVDASQLFLKRLDGIADPERKRVIIGNTFVEVFEQETETIAKTIGTKPRFLAQGTLYPDVIESISHRGTSATIKTHHNVGGLPEDHSFTIVEPFRELFKDEVREVGRLLGLSEEIVGRHPFPGPGLAVRVLGHVTSERLELLRRADAIFIEELRRHNLYDEVWQAFAVLLPVRSVGVMGDYRTYENVCALRAVTSRDGMTADWARLPYDFLGHVSRRIVNEVWGINRVTYDVSSKPPATIEWE